MSLASGVRGKDRWLELFLVLSLHTAVVTLETVYRPALVGLRRLCYELSQLGQAIVPGGDGPFKISYDPVITDGLHLAFKM